MPVLFICSIWKICTKLAKKFVSVYLYHLMENQNKLSAQPNNGSVISDYCPNGQEEQMNNPHTFEMTFT